MAKRITKAMKSERDFNIRAEFGKQKKYVYPMELPNQFPPDQLIQKQ
jgi:hypothetical protein